jgi:hypothetical protein
MSNNINVVIPIHEFNQETDRPFLEKALNSIKESESKPERTTIVITKELEYYNINDLIEEHNVTILKNNTDKTDFPSQINFFAKQNDTEYFLILEFDDELSNKAITNFEIYSNAYGQKVQVFLPIIADATLENQLIGYRNVEVFSKSVFQDDKIGLLNNRILQEYHLFNTSGGLFNTAAFNEINGFKSSLNIAFIYEYFLRATTNDQQIMVIPKLSLLHRNNREGSFLKSLNDRNITKEEVGFYYSAAKTEYFFLQERNLVYNETASN